jgi:hypothetical protein
MNRVRFPGDFHQDRDERETGKSDSDRIRPLRLISRSHPVDRLVFSYCHALHLASIIRQSNS